MTHPLVPQIFDLAAPIAAQLGLELIGVVFQTNQNPPVLRLDVRNRQTETGLNDCEKMSRALEEKLDSTAIIPGSYVLEVSSPGTSRQLATDREFVAFKGFAVSVKTYGPYDGKKEWRGSLQGRDEQFVYLSQKGKAIAIPRSLVAKVQLGDFG